jgi:hypothetical protein
MIEAGPLLPCPGFRSEGTTMPIHDWTRVDAGLFHAFHQAWITSLCNALNGGALPPDFFALAEQSVRGPVPDVLTLRLSKGKADRSEDSVGGVAVATAPPHARLVQTTEVAVYVRKADRVTIRHRHGQIIAVIEIVSPGNKASNTALRTFVEKACDLLVQGVHLLVIDLFPPTKRDPQGVHGAIWDELGGDDFALPADKPLTLAAYDAGPPQVAYVEPIAVGEPLAEMPIFLRPEYYVPAPLEATYQTAWESFPAALKGLLDNAADS